MRCWTARRRLADLLEGTLAESARASLDLHLAACADCRGERVRQEGVVHLLREAARSERPAVDAGALERRVMASVRTERPSQRHATGLEAFLRPAPLAAALVVMVVGGLTGLYLSGGGAGPGAGAAGIATGPSEDAWDRPADRPADPVETDVTALDEVVFRVRQDLVGHRRGRIPLTAYVLEPAPDEPAVVRASY